MNSTPRSFALHPRDILPKATTAAFQAPENKFLVARDISSSEVIGFVRYHVVEESSGASEEPEQGENEGGATQPTPSLFASKDHLKELWARFNLRDDDIDACYNNAAKGQRHVCEYFHLAFSPCSAEADFADVKHLMVDPRYQRQGIGGKLLSSVVAKSDTDRLPTFLVASAEAYGLYAKLGFEELGVFTIDNGYWATELAKCETELGITGNETLGQRFDGVKEVERVMVRWPR